MQLYKLTNTKNGKAYIGITQHDAKRRFKVHCSDARRGSDLLLARAIRKYGQGAFRIRVLARDINTWEELAKLERAAIKRHKSFREDGGYNLTRGGDGILGFSHKDETKMKMSKVAKGRKLTPEQIAKRTETRRKNNDGKYMTPLQEERRRAVQKPHPQTPETKAKIGKANRGRKHTDEAKLKMRKPISVNGIEYESFTAARLETGLGTYRLYKLLASGDAQYIR